jgi:hypothetical protein
MIHDVNIYVVQNDICENIDGKTMVGGTSGCWLNGVKEGQINRDIQALSR